MHATQMMSLPSLKQLDCISRTLTSQYGEDWQLLPTLLGVAAARYHTSGRTSGGRFVELGAYQGTDLSNSLLLERCYNWTGVLIEANPNNFAVLRTAGRRARLVHSAVCEGDGSSGTTVPITVNGMAVSGQVGAMSDTYIRKERRGDNISDVVRVNCRSLASIIRPESHRYDFLSLDVEGAEDKVLKTVDPSIFGVIMVEDDGYDKNKQDRVDRAINAAGLRRAKQLAVHLSGVYLRSDVREVPSWSGLPLYRGHCGAPTVAQQCEQDAPKRSVDLSSCVRLCRTACRDCRFVSFFAAGKGGCSFHADCGSRTRPYPYAGGSISLNVSAWESDPDA